MNSRLALSAEVGLDAAPGVQKHRANDLEAPAATWSSVSFAVCQAG